MIKLSDREWKEFKLEDIFYVELSKGDNKPNHLVKGNIPLISSGDSNNGIVKFVIKGDEKSQKFSKDKLTFDMFGKIFYHPYEFYSVSHGRINILSAKVNVSSFILIFLITVLEKSSKNIFSYNRMASSKRIKKLKFKIPITNENAPDYDFMEQYIKAKYFNLKSQIKEKQKHEITDWRELDEVKWEPFKMTDIFNEIQRGKRLTKSDQISGEKPYISSSGNYNGVDNFISNTKKIRQFENSLTLANSGSVGKTFYQPYEFVASDHITHLKSKKLNKYSYLFVANMFNRLESKYSFNREINDFRIKREKILLPTKNIQPDYEFMEQYMKRKENEILDRI